MTVTAINQSNSDAKLGLAIATNTTPSFNEGDRAPITTDLNGNLRVIIDAGAGYSISDLIVQDSSGTPVKGIRRESINATGTVTITYENFDGSVWIPTLPTTIVSPALPPGAATSANQSALNADGGSLAHVTNFPSIQASVPGPKSYGFSGFALVTNQVAKASAGIFYGVQGVNYATALRYIMVFDAAALPSNGTGTVPIAILLAQPGDNFFFDLGSLAATVSNGIVVAASTTSTSLTIDATANCQFTTIYS